MTPSVNREMQPPQPKKLLDQVRGVIRLNKPTSCQSISI